MQTIFNQWNKMIESGRIPLFEMKCINSESVADYYVFNIGMHPDGITFDIPNTDIKTWFSGNVVQLSACNFILPFDDCFDTLDIYLHEIYQEISEGYLLPNGIYEVE